MRKKDVLPEQGKYFTGVIFIKNKIFYLYI